eukprot:563105-Prorocentrum_lima.AAC.1
MCIRDSCERPPGNAVPLAFQHEAFARAFARPPGIDDLQRWCAVVANEIAQLPAFCLPAMQ